MQNNKIQKQAPLTALQLQLLDMGFELGNIQKAITLSNDKQKIIESLLAQKQLKSGNKQDELMDLKNQKDQNIMKDEKEQDDDFESEQEEYKMVFLARMDIKLSLGKMAAQVATAALSAFKQLQSRVDKDQMAEIAYYEWLQAGQKKIVVKVNSEEQLLSLAETIEKQKINLYIARAKKEDQLEIPEGTITVAAVGPAPQELVDRLTRHLKLF